MHLMLLAVGKTDSRHIEELTKLYADRLGHYLPFTLQIIPDIRRSSKLSPELQKQAEGVEILRLVAPTDRLVLFDERGRELSSKAFASYIERVMVSGERRMIFVIGGPYGFSDEVYARANDRVSLSQMTFSHQMVRLFAVEQLYRAQTILRGEPYHHE
ncbi:MAG: 23S rRNA (pseudouridine(1915)-N(3))-methyltransferase RlmH [Porphyromonas sp.]|jgi:ribosomal RNA large subunit methyltransferase H|uniref:23S rRNA (pseudouridine(1915)-N(3))-methyltransferase RlmH n=1 Tax=Porphyromonas sp. oral taxon 278 TaxID=712437 RepID=UPI0003AD068E|nr:23S rRNA (pseudouridine(1915)-N(3))-methyltransferase RlmH [Porphyromonas sp. oral taxon 278]ERJ71537.1 putative rRNA large subunit m3Psi methyltransferase RlmH [Porphyromonas sp. oral taxon 278 str. W7784]